MFFVIYLMHSKHKNSETYSRTKRNKMILPLEISYPVFPIHKNQ